MMVMFNLLTPLFFKNLKGKIKTPTHFNLGQFILILLISLVLLITAGNGFCQVI